MEFYSIWGTNPKSFCCMTAENKRLFIFKTVLIALATLLALFYPLFIYTNIQSWSPAVLVMTLAGLVYIRTFLMGNLKSLKNIVFLGVFSLFVLLVVLSNSELLLRFYPALMNVGIASLFLHSLFLEESLLESLVKKTGKIITLRIKTYLFTLTAIWGMLLSTNALIALWTAVYGELKFWAWYNGFFVYWVFAAVFLLEFAYRQYFKRKYGEQ